VAEACTNEFPILRTLFVDLLLLKCMTLTSKHHLIGLYEKTFRFC